MTKEISLVPTPEEFNIYQVMAKKASESQFFNKIGGEAGLLSIMLMARELGLPPLQSIMGGMNNIQGKIELSPRLMNAMIRKAGHKIEVLECNAQKCRLKGTRCDTDEKLEIEYSIEDAKRAGIFRAGGPWEKYPDDMNFKSALSKLARRLFADIISTAYIEGEIEQEAVAKKPHQRTEEIEVVEEKADPVIEYISAEEVQQIEDNLLPEDAEYRESLLRYFGNGNGCLEGFQKLPREKFTSCLKAVMKRKAKLMEKHEEARDS